jgi:hypothetical protein
MLGHENAMSTLKTVNDLAAAGMSEFALRSFDGSTLVVVGSFDLCYYHDVELTFTDVQHINCPTEFRDPTFGDVGPCDDGRRFSIESDGRHYEIVATDVAVTIAKVVYPQRIPLPSRSAQ